MFVDVSRALLIFEMIRWLNPLKIPPEIRLHSFRYRQMDVVSTECKCSDKHSALGVHELSKNVAHARNRLLSRTSRRKLLQAK